MNVVFSCVSFFVLLVLLFNHVVHAKFSFRPSNSSCVWTERQLRKVIEKAPNKTRTKIKLCRETISISVTGIDLTDRYIDLGCYLKRTKGRCTVNGKGSSQIFIGERADLTVRNVLFTNAKSDKCFSGGVIEVVSSSVSLTGCSFINNGDGCLLGGAISVEKSTLKITGGSRKWPVIFSNNAVSQGGGALYASKSNVSIDGFTVFSTNSGYLGGAVQIYKSTFNINNVVFVDNYGKQMSAIQSISTDLTMKNVEFLRNDGVYRAIGLDDSTLQATNCTFANHNVTAIDAMYSKVTLKNSTFSDNLGYYNRGSDIHIYDDEDPSSIGTFVKCESNVVFCNGLDRANIYEVSCDNSIGDFNNTDCRKEGMKGTPGQGSCPV